MRSAEKETSSGLPMGGGVKSEVQNGAGRGHWERVRLGAQEVLFGCVGLR